MKKQVFLLTIIMTFLTCINTYAADTGKEINRLCRSNLKALNKATERMMKETGLPIPRNVDLKTFYKTSDIKNFLDKPLVPPTVDCRYHLVSLKENKFQWYCELHGMLEGSRTISYFYHEHRLSGKINSEYETNEIYKKHVENMLHWTNYRQSPMEMIKYNYNANPLTTILIAVCIIIVSLIALKAIY